MFAIIKTGGKQYTVKPGDVLKIEKVDAESEVVFEEVLAVSKDGNLVTGAPVVENAKVTADILEEGKGKKILVFKKKRRKDYKKRYGHRQCFTTVKIKDIQVG